MNWTGGRLQRHSKQGGSAVLNRQRQHFAKVRTTLQNSGPQHRPPFRPEFIREDELLVSQLSPFSDRYTQHTGHSKSRQKTLYEYDSVVPVAQRLSSMGSRHAAASHHRDNRRRQSSRSKQRATPANRADSPTYSPRRASRDAQKPKKHSRRTRTSPREALSRTSSNRSLSKKHLFSGQQLEASKRKLLENEDWVGLAPSRPVRMHFASSKEKDRIGKRRKVESSMRARLGGEGRTLLLPIGQDRRDIRGPFMSGALPSKDDISIRIGTDALASRQSTQLDTEQCAFPQPAGHSSDSMLLDAEAVTYNTTHDRQRSGVGPGDGENHDGHECFPISVDASARGGTPAPMEYPDFPQQGSHISSKFRHPETPRANRLRSGSEERACEVMASGSEPDEAVMKSPRRCSVVGLSVEASGSQDATVLAEPFRLVFDSSSQNRHHDSETHRETSAPLERQRHQRQPGHLPALGIIEESHDSEQAVDDQPWRKLLALSASASSRATHTDVSRPRTRRGTRIEGVEEPHPDDSTDIDDCLRSLHATLGSSEVATAPPVRTMPTTAHVPAPSTNFQESTTETQQSPSASLRQLADLARKPPVEALAPSDGEDAWKRFVFGHVNSSSPESGQGGSLGDTPREIHGKAQHSSSEWSLAVGGRTSSDQTHLCQLGLVEPRPSSGDSVVPHRGENHEVTVGEERLSASMYNNAGLSEGSSPGRSSFRKPKQVKSTAATYRTSTQDEDEDSPDPLTSSNAPAIGNIHAAARLTPSGRARPKKIVFTKPAAFVGIPTEVQTMHIGRNRTIKKRSATRRRRKDSPSVYDIPMSDEIDDDVENVEG